MVTLGSINGWQPGDGSVITWTASAAARAAARDARRSDLAPTYQRSRHLRAAYDAKKTGAQLPRLMVVAWDMPGVCDIRAMTETINAHVRRHDAYHDWFEFRDGVPVRRMIDDPAVIDLVPTAFGQMGTEQIRAHALTTTPETLEWDCFTFGVIQHADYFTFYASIDHLHIDGMSAGLIFFDINLMYEQLSQGDEAAEAPVLPGIASYRSYAARQREQVASLTASSPGIRGWIEFAQDTRGDWPSFPLSVGDTEAGNKGAFLTVDLLDAAATESFEFACDAAGARFSGGVLACAALAEHEFTGTETYHGFTAYDTRTAGVDSMTVGWFANLVPVTVPIGATTFAEAARAAQKSYDDAKQLAGVPVERALELAAPQGIAPPTARAMMVSFMDFRKIPAATLFEQTNFGTYADSLSHGGINLWINRQTDKTTATISFPDNATARKSVHRYLAALTQAFAYAVNTTSDWVDAVAEHANSNHGIPVISL